MPLKPGLRSWLLRGHPFLAAVATFLVMGANLWPLHSPEKAFRATWYYDFYFTTFLLLAGWFFLLVVRRYFDGELFIQSQVLFSHAISWLVILLLTAVGIVAAELKWPLQVAFRISRPALEQMADEASAAPEDLGRFAGGRAGCFRVERVYVSGSTVILIIKHQDWNYGFARIPGELEHSINFQHRQFVDPYATLELPDNASAQRIFGDWFVVFDSYWAVKDGWSALHKDQSGRTCR